MTIRDLIFEFHEDFPNRLGHNIIAPSDERLPRSRERMVKEVPKKEPVDRSKLKATAQERFVRSRSGSKKR